MTYRSKVAVVYLLGFFLDLINLFIASVAFPAMSVELHTSISALAWVSNGYIAGLTLIVPFSAFLSRYLGARRLIIFSLILFSVAAAAAGFADSLHSLVFWRIVQGAGGGLLIPVGQALTWQQFKPHERAGVSSVVMMVALLAPACSPAIGGLLVETCGWRWIFFATLPVAVLTLLLAYRWLNVASTTMVSARLLHLPLLTDKLLRFAMIVYLCVPGMFIGISVVGMFYLQNVAQLSPAAAGSLMLPWSIASFVAIMLTGRYFNRLGPRPLIIVGCLLQAAGILLLTNVTPATSHRVLMMIFALMGAGGSLCSSTAQSGAFLTIARRDMPDASALWNLNRQISFFLGATLLTLLLNAFQRVMSLEVAYRWTFIAAAGITLLPLIYAVCLNNRQALLCLKRKTMNPYKEEIIHAHAAIENWLSKGMGSLEALIARFAVDFTMITPGGICLDYPALGAFFQAQRACRPGMVIVVEHIDLVAEWPEGAALRYRERQQLPGQAETVRWSTVILKGKEDG
ncbi:membrane transport protein [Salmonella enterica subsp. enterica serovar Enteritidis str. 22558]|nr:membrane transport protein [Salmonella enterica subsp. enterica serovar Enteritidis str. 22558]